MREGIRREEKKRIPLARLGGDDGEKSVLKALFGAGGRQGMIMVRGSEVMEEVQEDEEGGSDSLGSDGW